ncbi:MAG: carbohydrate-binding protein [Firmicutes bacterium]|nr:carbohydrate-binding protein [Bacillota bacterium]
MHYERVSVEPEIPRHNQNVEIHYKGLLAKSGADSVWLHYGFDGWNNVSTVPMKQQFGEFTCSIMAKGRRELNFCFKDSANNWDNNSGWNWSCPIR